MSQTTSLALRRIQGGGVTYYLVLIPKPSDMFTSDLIKYWRELGFADVIKLSSLQQHLGQTLAFERVDTCMRKNRCGPRGPLRACSDSWCSVHHASTVDGESPSGNPPHSAGFSCGIPMSLHSRAQHTRRSTPTRTAGARRRAAVSLAVRLLVVDFVLVLVVIVSTPPAAAVPSAPDGSTSLPTPGLSADQSFFTGHYHGHLTGHSRAMRKGRDREVRAVVVRFFRTNRVSSEKI